MEITLNPAGPLDFDFAFEAKKKALGPHIAARWGWDEDYQLSVHEQRWSEKPWFLVLSRKTAIGTVSILEEASLIRFGEFYLLPQWQRQGLGSRILVNVLARCDDMSRACQLEYLKWNPVGSLYRRHGFEVVGERDIHYFMLRQPRANNSLNPTGFSANAPKPAG